ncbi:ribose-phosphate pyrophosphokinase [Ructibacterium gallinarum]|uniref:ribose-phosphate diphosphokinase n=1 Tax=Ructibacterium gallinarum TaxID=2779355 RepID=A0A9D5M3N2_9FIRM|nr:ribose-phosphate pyrophosphokinase [Ructibacterium gallinarum]MBE5040094.1 ribose-phosphate pyrophosphokinase [Ructibacterium gallinarum]
MESAIESYNLGRLGVIGMKGCEEITCKINRHLQNFNEGNDNQIDTFIIPITCPRFGTGEAKAMIMHSIRTYDVYIVMDAFNYGVTYSMYGKEHPMSPDDHYQDLKRVISAMGGKAKRITVIMPMLYEGRQHKRVARESLDCALALQELENMGVDNIITFDAHDARVQNAVPLNGFENVHATYQMIKACLRYDSGIILNKDQTMIISPDEGAMGRCMYYSSVLGMDLGMFYKRRDYSTIIDGKNPIVAHEFLGNDLAGKDVIVVDDMIASGDSMIDVARELKKRKAKRVLVFATFGLFTEGISKFNQAYEEGLFDAVFTTNLVYRRPELLQAPWYHEVDMSKYIALLIKTLNEEKSISDLLTPISRIEKILNKYRNQL